MANLANKQIPLAAILTLLLTHCYAVLAILDRKAIFVEDEPRRNYRLEDFLWTGSGDGQDGTPEESHKLEPTWQTTTIFRTTTILTTVFPTPIHTGPILETSSTICQGDDCHIKPTPTFSPPSPTVRPPWPPPTPPWLDITPDERFWLVTVIKTNTTTWNLATDIFEPRLAKLYKTAFQRQLERHLGLNGGATTTKKRRSEGRDVYVRVHNVTVTDDGNLELVYSVRVAGKPILAVTAATDMRLVSDKEVIAELGYPVLTKAEPYLKVPEPLGGASRQRDAWLLIAAGISAIILLLVVISLFVIGFGRHKRKQRRVEGSANRSRVFEREQTDKGEDNMAFHEDDSHSRVINPDSPSRLSGRSGVSSEASLVRRSPPCPPKPRPRSHKASSPNSYLSMPSVKAFPRGPPIPGPLELVLEPEEETPTVPTPSPTVPPSLLARHGSVEGEDPGVIGPVVWDLHCHRLQKQDVCFSNMPTDCLDFEEDISLTDPNVGQMRRRFHELLDDAFSLFGSHSDSVEQDSSSPTNTQRDIRAKSALVRPVCETETILRPKTTDSKRPATAIIGRPPRGAWEGTTPTTPPTRPPPRPLSAGPFHKPVLEPARILSNATLQPSDPAVPLIAAIRQELDKFPSMLPGTSQYKV